MPAGRWASLGGAAFLTLLVAACSVFATAGPALGTSSAVCGTIKAGGHVYTVGAEHGVTCPFALKWAATLVKKPVPAHTANARLSGSPSGFSCVGNTKMSPSSIPGVGATTQVLGFCRKGSTSSGPFFNWFINT
jgi:hypothetical protein